jgi:spore coat polysaccharide biosynthesis protein SpsF
VKQSERVDQVMVATSTLPADDAIALEAEHLGIPCVRGSEEDVLSRYLKAATIAEATDVVRITSDCPLVDPELIDCVIKQYQEDGAEYARLDLSRFPRGMDVEVVSLQALTRAYEDTDLPLYREHVTLYIYEHPEWFKHTAYREGDPADSRYRLTLDTPQDWEVIAHIFSALYKPGQHLDYKQIIRYLNEHPEIAALNKDVEQKHHTI